MGPQGPKGPPGEDYAPSRITHCFLDWPFEDGKGSRLSYTVMEFVSGAKMISLTREYYFSTFSYSLSSSALWPSGQNPNAEIEDSAFSVSLSNKTATFTRLAYQEKREIICD
jgi:hypothetical protein